MDGSSSTRKSKSLRRRLDRGEDDFNDRWGDQELSEEEQEQLEQPPAKRARRDDERQEAEEIWQGIEGLYRDSPFARDILDEVKRDRGGKAR